MLSIMLPALMGGCPELRTKAVDAIETATRDVVDFALTQVFDQLRGNTSP